MFLVSRWFAPTAGVALCAALAADLSAASSPEAAAGVPSREMSTDRPDATESPYTLEPGRTQLEMSFASYELDRRDGVRTTTWEAAPFNVRFGLTRSFEAGFIFLPHQRVAVRDREGEEMVQDGIGDFTARAKWNLLGNDDPGLAAGVIVDVTLPTAPREFGPRKVEFAVTVPAAFDLGGGWSGGAMTSVQMARNDDGARRPRFLNTLTAGHDLVGGLAGFVELVSVSGEGRHLLTFNCGVTHQLNPDLQLDAGVNLGVSRTAPDVLWFAGLSRRF